MPLELELCPGRWVGGQHPCFIIAEIGQNHQGDLEVAKRMIRTAKVRGAAAGPRHPMRPPSRLFLSLSLSKLSSSLFTSLLSVLQQLPPNPTSYLPLWC